MKVLNEDFIQLNENMKFEALSQLRDIQSNLVSVSFLPVIAIMKETNPLKKEVLKFQDDLDKLTMEIQEFISKAKEDVEYNSDEEGYNDPEGEDPNEDSEEEEDADKEGSDNSKKDKTKEVEDSSEPKV